MRAGLPFVRAAGPIMLLLGAHQAGAEGFELFNGRDLRGWEFVPVEASSGAGPEVVRGKLRFSGSAPGYLQTQRPHGEFQLTLEWRWRGASERPRNGGVMVGVNPNGRPWPRSYEIDLSAHMSQLVEPAPWGTGDIWLFDVPTPASPEEAGRLDRQRKEGQVQRLVRLSDAERRFGQWNRLRIDASGGAIRVHLNGKLVNRISNAGNIDGRIALQSTEGTIEFRRIKLARR